MRYNLFIWIIMKALMLLVLVMSALASKQDTMSSDSEGCTCGSYLGDAYCDDECDTAECNYDNNDCCHGDCVYGCDASQLGDGSCDQECNYECCEWDAGDCS